MTALAFRVIAPITHSLHSSGPITRWLRASVLWGRRSRTAVALLFGVLSLASVSCYGFAGGGLDPNIKTVAIIPFDNETPSSDLPRELTEALREALEKRLGLRAAPEERADAVVRGKITRYELDIPIAVSANRQQSTSARRRLAVSVDIEIVRQSDGSTIWRKTAVQAEGEYAENAEASGRKQAIERIITDVIEGAQSQW